MIVPPNPAPSNAGEGGNSSSGLAVIVPAYNEERTIEVILSRIVAVPFVQQVIVVDDGSTDGTLGKLDPWRTHPAVTVLQNPGNRGKGFAIRTGLAAARAQYVIIQDADLEYDPQDYQRLLEPLWAKRADAVYGSRYAAIRAEGFKGRVVSTLGIAVINTVVRLLYGVKLTDEATCYKVFRREDLVRMQLACDGFEFCPEVTAKAARMGLSIVEVPIRYAPRSVAEGKKIRLRDGWTALKSLWRWRNWKAEK